MEREKHGDREKFICNLIVVSLFAARLDSGYLFWWCVRGAGAGAGAGSCCITTWEAEVERTRMVPALSLAKGSPVSLPKLEFLFICNMER